MESSYATDAIGYAMLGTFNIILNAEKSSLHASKDKLDLLNDTYDGVNEFE